LRGSVIPFIILRDVKSCLNENLDYTPAQLKQKISNIANVTYCGYSASGLGVWALIPLFDPSKHLEHFKAL
jgi:hypothetical protein